MDFILLDVRFEHNKHYEQASSSRAFQRYQKSENKYFSKSFELMADITERNNTIVTDSLPKLASPKFVSVAKTIIIANKVVLNIPNRSNPFGSVVEGKLLRTYIRRKSCSCSECPQSLKELRIGNIPLNFTNRSKNVALKSSRLAITDDLNSPNTNIASSSSSITHLSI